MRTTEEYLKDVYDSLLIFEDLPKYGFELIKDYGFNSTKTSRKVLILHKKSGKQYLVTESHHKEDIMNYVREISVLRYSGA